MPNGTFWIKSPKGMQAMLVVAVEEDKIFYLRATSGVACGTYGRSTIEQAFSTIARLNELGYKWSHDRETWNSF